MIENLFCQTLILPRIGHFFLGLQNKFVPETDCFYKMLFDAKYLIRTAQ
jgi:hypothetical protein